MRLVRHPLLALSFLTRIPVPKLDLAKTDFGRAVVYFPTVGTIIGALGSGVFLLANLWFSTAISVCLALGFLMLVTGALHEDGIADSFDAFGSKVAKADILEVMRDSRIGTYGSLALIFVFVLKLLSLQEMHSKTIVTAFILSHTISRWALLPAISLLPYPRKSATVSKRFVESVSTMPKWHILASAIYTVLLAFLLFSFKGIELVILASLTSLLLTYYFWRRIGGATGDCYGTIQQCTEVVMYLAILKLS